jgi:S-adenosylmethionine hydrolase
MTMRCIVLLTDFGIEDNYVGIMKGVIASIAPAAQMIDLSHSIPPQDIRQGAISLLTSYTYFPPDTIFVVVVDPGVGGVRRPVIARAGTYHFIAPDNGVLSYALNRDPNAQVYEITSLQHRLSRVSNTFHGRDVFAPAAGYLCSGVTLEELGAPLNDYVHLPPPRLEIGDSLITGEVISVDHFGNITTSIGLLTWQHAGELLLTHPFESRSLPVSVRAQAAIRIDGSARISGIVRTYSDVGAGELLALVGSSGFLEIAVNQGDARSMLQARVGSVVELHLG